MTEDFTAKMLNKGALLFFWLWEMDLGPAYFFGCEKWTLGELINLIDLAVKNGLWAQAKAQAMAKAWQAIN